MDKDTDSLDGLVEAFHLYEQRRHARQVCLLVVSAGLIMLGIFALAVLCTPHYT